MKHIVLTLLLITSIGTMANAQIAPELGLTMADLSLKSGGTSVKTGFKPGFIGGLMVDLKFTDHIYLQPGIFYDMTGCKTTDQPTGKYTLGAINIPINIEYKSGTKCGARFFAGVGVYFTNIISGTYASDAYGPIPATSTTLKIGTDATSNIKGTDFGIGLNAGYQFKSHFYFRARYQIGLANLYPSGDGNNSIKASEFNLTVGYMFARCRVNYNNGGGGHGRTHWRGMSKAKYSRRVQHTWN